MKKLTAFVLLVTSVLAPLSVSLGADSWINATATFLPNKLPVDGCDHTVVIGKNEFALDSTSYSKISAVFDKLPLNKPIRQSIVYSPTGNTMTVQCGRGMNKQLPEIKLISVMPKYLFMYATLQPDQLPADGCQHTVTVGSRNYALDASSYNAVQNAFTSAVNPWNPLRKRISYRVTGKTWSVTCGWGTSQVLPQINIRAIY